MTVEEASTGRRNPPETTTRRSVWTPIYPLSKVGKQIPNALPIDWRCPCGALLGGGKTCPRCGRSILDDVKTIAVPSHVLMSRGEHPQQAADSARRGYELRRTLKAKRGRC